MPYANNYNTSLPDAGEARLLAMQAMTVASLADLNSSLNRDALSPMRFISSQVILGDPETVTKSLICFVGGGKQDGTDMELGTGPQFMPRSDNTAPSLSVHTNIYVYLHPDDLIPAPTGDTAADALRAVQYLETARARIVGHLRRRVFNSQAASVITLGSQEFNGTGYDQLLNARIVSVRNGVTFKGAGGNLALYSAHLAHEGTVQ